MIPMAEKIDDKTHNGHKVVGVVLRSQAKTLHFLRHAEGLSATNRRHKAGGYS